jgi:hypothetical protein
LPRRARLSVSDTQWRHFTPSLGMLSHVAASQDCIAAAGAARVILDARAGYAAEIF